MHPSIQDSVVNQALLVRLAKEDNDERDCFYGRPELQPVDVSYHHTELFRERAPVSRSLSYGGGSGRLVSDPWQELPKVIRARHFFRDFLPSPAEDSGFQLLLTTALASDAYFTKLSAVFFDTHFVGERSGPDYSIALARLREFESEDHDWDGMGGEPADSSTVCWVRVLLNQVRSLNISRPSLTLSNNGAVSVIWKDDVRFVNLKFKGGDQYSAIILVNREPFLTTSSPVSELPPKLQTFLIESFREDVTAHLSELPNGLR